MTPFVRSTVLALVSIILTGILLVASTNSFGEEHAKKLDGKAIFDQKCLKCHKVEKFRSLQHDSKGWEIVLSRMERSKSCTLSDDERSAVAEYLSKQYGE